MLRVSSLAMGTQIIEFLDIKRDHLLGDTLFGNVRELALLEREWKSLPFNWLISVQG
jgi:hypothetical protein